MCGRYRLTAKERYFRDHFGLDEDPPWTPRWNIAPTQQVPIVRQDRKEPKRSFALVRRGLIPYWAKDPVWSKNSFGATNFILEIFEGFKIQTPLSLSDELRVVCPRKIHDTQATSV